MLVILPCGSLSAIKNTTNKTLTVSGTPTTNGSFTVTTIGGNPAVQVQASVTLNQNSVLAIGIHFKKILFRYRFVVCKRIGKSYSR